MWNYPNYLPICEITNALKPCLSCSKAQSPKVIRANLWQSLRLSKLPSQVFHKWGSLMKFTGMVSLPTGLCVHTMYIWYAMLCYAMIWYDMIINYHSETGPCLGPKRLIHRSELVFHHRGFHWLWYFDMYTPYTIWLFNIAMENPVNKWRFS